MQRGQRYGMNSIFHRISVRKYQNRDVEQEKIELMLKAAMAAPSACNQQPWEFYVVKDKAVIGRLSEASPYAKCARDAPVVFVPCFRSKGIAPEYFNIDMSAAVENLLLEADELGLGAVWMGISPDEGRMKAVREVLDIPEGLHAFALIPCGYPAEERAQEDRYEESRVHYYEVICKYSESRRFASTAVTLKNGAAGKRFSAAPFSCIHEKKNKKQKARA